MHFVMRPHTVLLFPHSSHPPAAWACTKVCDKRGKCLSDCPPTTCNAVQANIGGEVLVLDVDSYSDNQDRSFRVSVASSCCKACQDLDGCNVWVLCTKKVSE